MPRPAVDLTGQRHGHLFVASRAPRPTGAGRGVYWNCRCDCGAVVVMRRDHAQRVDASCGCRPFLAKIGKTFGSWTVIDFERTKPKDRHRRILARCACGTERWMQAKCIESGASKSCGCQKGTLISERFTLPHAAARRNFIARTYRRGAAERGLAFALTDAELDALFRSDCYYCGEPPSNVARSRTAGDDFVYSGIDRVDNARGYVRGNVVPCCWVCNRRKADADPSEFIGWAQRIAARHPSHARRAS